MFVRDTDKDIVGLVTRFDLNALPVYGHLYDRFSEFEIGVRELIRTHAPDWEDETNEHIPYRGKRNVVQDKLVCAELGTLLSLIEEFELESKLPTDEFVNLGSLRNLRNDVAHYVPIVHTMSERSTFNETTRGAPQLAKEYQYLRDCVACLEAEDGS